MTRKERRNGEENKECCSLLLTSSRCATRFGREALFRRSALRAHALTQVGEAAAAGDEEPKAAEE